MDSLTKLFLIHRRREFENTNTDVERETRRLDILCQCWFALTARLSPLCAEVGLPQTISWLREQLTWFTSLACVCCYIIEHCQEHFLVQSASLFIYWFFIPTLLAFPAFFFIYPLRLLFYCFTVYYSLQFRTCRGRLNRFFFSRSFFLLLSSSFFLSLRKVQRVVTVSVKTKHLRERLKNAIETIIEHVYK